MPIQTTIGTHAITLTDEERQECEVWTRVMGYYRPVNEFNIGKRQEHRERVFFRETTTPAEPTTQKGE